MPSLSDSVAVVTGASSGIGEATARLLARHGATVALAARREDKLDALQSAVEEAGGAALVVPTDVTDRDAVKALAQAALDAYGRIDILVNNAGVMPLTLLRNMRTDDYRTLDVNVRGVMHAVEAVLPTMMAQERGHVVNVSSGGRCTPAARSTRPRSTPSARSPRGCARSWGRATACA